MKVCLLVLASAIISFLALTTGYTLVHSGIVLLLLLAPGYFYLENAGALPSPGGLQLLTYFSIQIAYHAVVFATYRLVRRPAKL